jgi:beta-galactosidase
VRNVYVPLRKRGIDVDILPPSTTDFSGYDLVVIPALFAWNDALRTAIENFDGRLLIGPRSGSKTENFSIPIGLGPDLPQNLLDAKVARVDSADPRAEVSVKRRRCRAALARAASTPKPMIVIEDEEDFPVLVNAG